VLSPKRLQRGQLDFARRSAWPQYIVFLIPC
jgi:hypothetical protein